MERREPTPAFSCGFSILSEIFVLLVLSGLVLSSLCNLYSYVCNLLRYFALRLVAMGSCFGVLRPCSWDFVRLGGLVCTCPVAGYSPQYICRPESSGKFPSYQCWLEARLIGSASREPQQGPTSWLGVLSGSYLSPSARLKFGYEFCLRSWAPSARTHLLVGIRALPQYCLIGNLLSRFALLVEFRSSPWPFQ